MPSNRSRAVILAALAAAALLTALAAPPAALAADDTGPTTWQVQPAGENGPSEQPYFVLDAAPGATLQESAVITNLSEHAITLRVFGTDALNAASGDFDLLPSATEPQDIGAWMTMDPGTIAPDGSVTVPARARLRVPFTISIPANATPGDHVGGVVTSMSGLRTNDSGEQVLVDARVAARIYLAVNGDLAPRLQVGDVRAQRTGEWWNPFAGTLTVTWTATNTGNLRLSGGQQVSVDGPFGWDLGGSAEVELPELLPGSSVTQSAELTGIPAALLLTVDGTLRPADPTGRVTAPLPAVPFSGTVLAVPWILVVALLIVAALVWGIVFLARRRGASLRSLRDELATLQAAQKAGDAAAPSPAPVPSPATPSTPSTPGVGGPPSGAA